MQSSRELDALIEKHVFNRAFRPFASILTSIPAQSVPETPFYSTDIKAAWEVVEKLGPSAAWIQRMSRTGVTRDSTEPELVEYTRRTGGHPAWRVKFGNDGRWAFSDSVPHAICLAALKAVGHNV